MKFDPDLVREILIRVESIPAGTGSGNFVIEGKETPEIYRHLQILLNEDFIDGKFYLGPDGFPTQFFITDLTYKGHQFLENARNDSSWNKAKHTLQEKGVGLTMNFIQDVLVKFATSSISG